MNNLKSATLLLMLSMILLSNNNGFCQCAKCQTYGVTVFNTDMKIAQPNDPQLFPGWNYLRNQCGVRLKQSIKENEVNPDCILIYDGSFVHTNNGATSLNSQNTSPTGSLPISSNGHYLIRSEVIQSTGAYSISFFLETSKSREVVKSFTRTFTDFSVLGVSQNDIGKNAGFQAFSPLSMIIRSFETRKREKDKGIAIEANPIEVLPHAKSVKKGEKITVAFRLTDCDGEVLSGRKILLNGGSAMGEILPPSTMGHFSETEVTTDNSGVAKATFVAGKQKGKAQIRVYYTYTAPFGEERYTKGEAIIDIEREPVTELIGEIEINSTTRTGSPTIARPEISKSDEQDVCISSLNLTIVPERIKNINRSKEVLQSALTEFSEFSVVHGKTMVDERGEPTLIRSEATFSEYGLCDGKFELKRSGKRKGYSNGFDVSVRIALERGIKTGNIINYNLSPKYCLVITPGSNSRQLFQGSKYKTSGDEKGQEREYPCSKLKPFSRSFDGNSYLDFGISESTIKVNDQENDEFFIPLSIAATEALEQYLLDPQGIYTINVNGSYRKKDYEEKEVKINAKLTIWPKE